MNAPLLGARQGRELVPAIVRVELLPNIPMALIVACAKAVADIFWRVM
jgi:hypothetical protein